MQLFIDTANPDEVAEAWDTGLISGVTTNPTLVAKSGYNYKDAVREILKIIDGPVSLEVLGTTSEEMIKEGLKLSKIHPNIVVKIPMGIEGIRAVHALTKEGVQTNVTLVFSATQALLAAKAGATYVSLFIGRLTDNGINGIDVLNQVRTVFDNYEFETEILAASFRTTLQVAEVAEVGADVATIPPAIFWKMFSNSLTDIGLVQFLNDFKEAGIEPIV